MATENEKIVREVERMVVRGDTKDYAFQVVARKEGLTFDSVKHRYFRNRPHSPHHASRALTEEEERILVTVLVSYANVDMGFTTTQVREAVNLMFSKEIAVGTCWNLLQRHKDVLKSSVTKPLGKERAKSGLYEEAMEWVTKMECFVGQKKRPPHSVVNYDESRIILSQDGKVRIKRLVSKNKKKAQARTNVKGKHCGTFLPFISASGELLKFYFIFSAKFDESDQANVTLTLPSTLSFTRTRSVATKIFFTNKGYLDNPTFDLIMADFTSHWNTLYPGLECLCFGDNLGAHRQIPVIHDCLTRGVLLCFLVAHTSHWSQPLDDLLFALLKNEVALVCSKLAFL